VINDSVFFTQWNDTNVSIRHGKRDADFATEFLGWPRSDRDRGEIRPTIHQRGSEKGFPHATAEFGHTGDIGGVGGWLEPTQYQGSEN
jgi:hypothetical protein